MDQEGKAKTLADEIDQFLSVQVATYAAEYGEPDSHGASRILHIGPIMATTIRFHDGLVVTESNVDFAECSPKNVLPWFSLPGYRFSPSIETNHLNCPDRLEIARSMPQKSGAPRLFNERRGLLAGLAISSAPTCE